jgi:hypothetical protein
MRSIVEGSDFARFVDQVGGYRLVDEVLDPILEALSSDPYGFPLIENDHFRIRYVVTKSVEGRIPALIVAFVINQNHDVVLEWIDLVDDGDLPE